MKMKFFLLLCLTCFSCAKTKNRLKSLSLRKETPKEEEVFFFSKTSFKGQVYRKLWHGMNVINWLGIKEKYESVKLHAKTNVCLFSENNLSGETQLVRHNIEFLSSLKLEGNINSFAVVPKLSISLFKERDLKGSKVDLKVSNCVRHAKEAKSLLTGGVSIVLSRPKSTYQTVIENCYYLPNLQEPIKFKVLRSQPNRCAYLYSEANYKGESRKICFEQRNKIEKEISFKSVKLDADVTLIGKKGKVATYFDIEKEGNEHLEESHTATHLVRRGCVLFKFEEGAKYEEKCFSGTFESTRQPFIIINTAEKLVLKHTRGLIMKSINISKGVFSLLKLQGMEDEDKGNLGYTFE